MLDNLYCPEITILGFSFTSTVARSGNVTWSNVTGRVKTLASDVYGRDLCLTQRIQHVHAYLLSVTWHTAHIFPASKEHERQLLTAISWYILRGAFFRVPLSTLTRRTEEGGLNLIDIAAKCRALFLTRFWAQRERDGSLTVAWLNVWALLFSGMKFSHPTYTSNPREYGIPTYLFSWMGVYGTPEAGRNTEIFTRRNYDTLQTISTAGNRPREVRVMQLQPGIDWSIVWGNLHNVRFLMTQGQRGTWWYMT
jgi:hypothetical protein